MSRFLLIVLVFTNLNLDKKADETSNILFKSISIADNLPVFVKSENNWIQKKEKDEWITKKDKKEWIIKKDSKAWITKKEDKTNDLAYITLLPLAIIIIYIKRTFK